MRHLKKFLCLLLKPLSWMWAKATDGLGTEYIPDPTLDRQLYDDPRHYSFELYRWWY